MMHERGRSRSSQMCVKEMVVSVGLRTGNSGEGVGGDVSGAAGKNL